GEDVGLALQDGCEAAVRVGDDGEDDLIEPRAAGFPLDRLGCGRGGRRRMRRGQQCDEKDEKDAARRHETSPDHEFETLRSSGSRNLNWASTSERYRPPFMRLSWLPDSTIRPWSRTMILSALRMGESRWASTMAGRSARRRSRAFWICTSLSVSTLAVASSRMRMRGSAKSARAKEMRCLWPRERPLPRSLTSVSYP